MERISSTLRQSDLEEFIEPQEPKAAQRWIERHCNADRIEPSSVR